LKITEQSFRIKNKKKQIIINNKGIKLRQIKTKNNQLQIRIYNGTTLYQLPNNKKRNLKKKLGLNLPVGVYIPTKKLGISIHNSERFQKRQRKKRALAEAKQRKKPKLTAAQKSKAKKAAKLKKKLRKLKYK